MENILEKIIAVKRQEVSIAKQERPIEKLMQGTYFDTPCRSLASSLRGSKTGIIAEFKRKSPSLGWIHADAVPEEVTSAYSDGGASGISILTDESFFGGHLTYIERCRMGVKCPILRKDFIIDEYQLYEAKSVGADAVLLIAAALTKKEAYALARKAHELGLETLMEVHAEDELDKLNEFVDMVGVNSRNLKTFKTDVQVAVRLSELLPKEMVKVAESGIHNVETIERLRRCGFEGFLMGECFMSQSDPGKALSNVVSELEQRGCSPLKVKVCGMRDAENIKAIASLRPEYMGFIFYEKSPRYVGNLFPKTIQSLPYHINKVGVFVNAPVTDVVEASRKYGLNVVQLHGQESVEQVRELRSQGLKVIKAISVKDEDSVSAAQAYEGEVDFLLFDTATKDVGGSGRHFDWNVLKMYRGKTPYFLSGGIGHEDLSAIEGITDCRCAGIDINSRFEKSPGLKNEETVSKFIEAIRLMNKSKKQ